MRLFLIFFAFAIAVIGAELTYDAMNKLDQDTLTQAIYSNYTVLVMWTDSKCAKCNREIWEVYRLIYVFIGQKFVVLSANSGDTKELEDKYKVRSSIDNSDFRLFVDGHPSPIAYNSKQSLLDFITENSELKALPDYVTTVDNNSYKSYMKKNEKRNKLLFFCMVSVRQCQQMVTVMWKTAYAYERFKKVAFGFVNCEESQAMCQTYNLHTVPAFRYISAENPTKILSDLVSSRGEGVTNYLNEKTGLFVNVDGSLTEQYGRDKELDEIAQEFATSTDKKERGRLLQRVHKLQDKYKSTARYFKTMKDVILKGDSVVDAERNEIDEAIAKITRFDDPEYVKLRARENVIHQFEPIFLKNALVTLNPWNFHNIMNGKHTVLLKVFAQWCGHCKQMAPIYEDLAREGFGDVVFAELDGDTYRDLSNPYHIEGFPTLLFFKKGADVKTPINAEMDRTREGIIAYLDEVINGVMRPEKPAQAEQDEVHNHLEHDNDSDHDIYGHPEEL